MKTGISDGHWEEDFDMIGFSVGIIGAMVFCDAIASLYTYTGKGEKAGGQTFWRDHSLRCLRMLYGVALIVLGAILVNRGI